MKEIITVQLPEVNGETISLALWEWLMEQDFDIINYLSVVINSKCKTLQQPEYNFKTLFHLCLISEDPEKVSEDWLTGRKQLLLKALKGKCLDINQTLDVQLATKQDAKIKADKAKFNKNAQWIQTFTQKHKAYNTFDSFWQNPKNEIYVKKIKSLMTVSPEFNQLIKDVKTVFHMLHISGSKIEEGSISIAPLFQKAIQDNAKLQERYNERTQESRELKMQCDTLQKVLDKLYIDLDIKDKATTKLSMDLHSEQEINKKITEKSYDQQQVYLTLKNNDTLKQQNETLKQQNEVFKQKEIQWQNEREELLNMIDALKLQIQEQEFTVTKQTQQFNQSQIQQFDLQEQKSYNKQMQSIEEEKVQVKPEQIQIQIEDFQDTGYIPEQLFANAITEFMGRGDINFDLIFNEIDKINKITNYGYGFSLNSIMMIITDNPDMIQFVTQQQILETIYSVRGMIFERKQPILQQQDPRELEKLGAVFDIANEVFSQPSAKSFKHETAAYKTTNPTSNKEHTSNIMAFDPRYKSAVCESVNFRPESNVCVIYNEDQQYTQSSKKPESAEQGSDLEEQKEEGSPGIVVEKNKKDKNKKKRNPDIHSPFSK